MSKQPPNHSLKAISAVLNAARILRRLGPMMILLLMTAVSLAGCRATDAATPEATPIPATLTAEVPAAATVQAPQAKTISVNGAVPTESAPAWTPPSGNEFITPSDEMTPDSITPFDGILKNGLSKYGITLERTEYHSNGLSGDYFQWTVTGKDSKGNVIWAFDPAGNQMKYPVYYGPVTDAAGIIIDYKVIHTINGQSIEYKAVPDSKGADVVFVVNDTLPTLVKDRVTTPDGRQVFLKYFDATTGKWIDNPNSQVLDANGKPMTWNGTKWVKTITSCADIEPTTSLDTPEIKAIMTGVSKGFALKVSENRPEVVDYVDQVSWAGFLESIGKIPIHTEDFDGEALCLFVVVNNPTGPVRLPILGAIKSNSGDFGHPLVGGEVYRSTFSAYGQPETYDKLVRHYESITGHYVSFVVNFWKGDKPLDPPKYATAIYRETTYDLTATPGDSTHPWADVMHHFVEAFCGSSASCRAQTISPESWGDMKLLREQGLANPSGIIVSVVVDVGIPK